MDADRAATEQPADPAGTCAVQRIDEDGDVGGAKRVEIDRPAHEALVAVVGIERLDHARCVGVGERSTVDRHATVDRQPGLDRGEDLGTGGRTGRCLDLEPVVDPRVVARGDHDAGRGAPLHDLERAHLGRHGLARQRDRDAAGEEHLGGGCREMLRREPPVEGHDHAPRGRSLLFHVVGDTIGAAPHVLERELVGDPRPPAVGAEDDRRGLGHTGRRGHSASNLRAAFDEGLDDADVRR